MRFGVRIPSLRKRISARLSPMRYVRHSLGLKAPRGWGWVTSPRRALYNRIYNRTTFRFPGCLLILGAWSGLLVIVAVAIRALAP